jgi:CheY-like chemotaxis protein
MASILVVDDNATNRKLVVALLSHDGHLTFEAHDGAEALQVAGEARPQLVISDILMPTMDGFEFLRRLRAIAELSHIPVIFHTAHYHEREAHQLALAGGAARVLLKPCPAAQLLQAVEQVLAGVSESDAHTMMTHFDREHLLLITNKLAEKANALGASNARLRALAQLNVAVAAEREPRVLLQKACDETRSLLGSRFALLVVTDAKGPEEPIFATSGVDFSATAPKPLQLHAGRLCEVLSGRPTWRLSGGAASDIDLGLPSGYPAAASALLAVPLESPKCAYGWLCLCDKVGATGFEAEDEDVLSILGAQFALLYESASERVAARQHLSRFHTLLSGMTSLLTQAQSGEEVLQLLGELSRGISMALDGLE